MKKFRKLNVIIIVTLAILILWTLWGYFSSRVEQTDYTVSTKTADYEIREYPAHLVAQTTTAEGSYQEGLNQGFRILAGYIFGGNTKKESIAMTAPVTARKNTSQKIAMTAPVLSTRQGDEQVIAFGMPRSYSLETLPIPNDSRITIVEVPSKTVAAIRFSGIRTEKQIRRMNEKLLSALARDSVKTIGSVSYAGYNAPWTPPWMTRHEVMIELYK